MAKSAQTLQFVNLGWRVSVDPSLSQTVSTKPEVPEPAVKEKTVNTPASVKAADETNPKSPAGSESAGEEKSDE